MQGVMMIQNLNVFHFCCSSFEFCAFFDLMYKVFELLPARTIGIMSRFIVNKNVSVYS